MRFILCSILILSSATVGAADVAFDLKGIALGALEAEVTARFPGMKCRHSSAATAERMCTVLKDSYGGAEASLFFALIGGKVSNMSARFNPRDFAEVVAAMKERFGPPSSEETEMVTNRTGAQFENKIITWKRGGEIVIATRYSGSVDRASVTFVSEASVDEFKSRARHQQRERAKDL